MNIADKLSAVHMINYKEHINLYSLYSKNGTMLHVGDIYYIKRMFNVLDRHRLTVLIQSQKCALKGN